MSGLLARFRADRAEVRIESTMKAPPGELSGGVALVSVTLTARQSLMVLDGRLELALLTTRFSRTALDGYFEHTSREVRRTLPLCGDAAVRPGVPLVRSLEIHLPPVAIADSRPARVQWQVRARFAARNHRELAASVLLCDVSPAQGGAPVVDGSGFLPLYEFRTPRNS